MRDGTTLGRAQRRKACPYMEAVGFPSNCRTTAEHFSAVTVNASGPLADLLHTEMFTLIVKKPQMFFFVSLCRPHLPVFRCRLDRTTDDLANGSLVPLHYQIVLLMFLSDDVVGLAMLLVALGVHFRGPLDKEGVEVVDPVNKRTFCY